jgi:hypothetical protein
MLLRQPLTEFQRFVGSTTGQIVLVFSVLVSKPVLLLGLFVIPVMALPSKMRSPPKRLLEDAGGILTWRLTSGVIPLSQAD